MAGLFHPMHLGYGTARTCGAPLLGMFVFPLVGVALAWLFRGRRDVVAVLAVLLAYVYAVAYTALDVISGSPPATSPTGSGRAGHGRTRCATCLRSAGHWGSGAHGR